MTQKLFSQRTLRAEELVGRRLSDQRRRHGWTLERVAEVAQVPMRYLEALEKGDYKNLPAEVYGKNFVRKYAKILGLPEEEMVEDFLLEKSSYETLNHVKSEPKFRERVSASSLMSSPKILRAVIIGLVGVLLLSYLATEIQKITTPPFLRIDAPEDNATLRETEVMVRGKTDAEAKVIVNDEEVFGDADGGFEKVIKLHEGINIITISAKKKRSKETRVLRTLLME